MNSNNFFSVTKAFFPSHVGYFCQHMQISDVVVTAVGLRAEVEDDRVVEDSRVVLDHVAPALKVGVEAVVDHGLERVKAGAGVYQGGKEDHTLAAEDELGLGLDPAITQRASS